MTSWERTQVSPWVRAIPTTLEFQSLPSNNELVVVLIFENIHYIVIKFFISNSIFSFSFEELVKLVSECFSGTNPGLKEPCVVP